jgi:hypothetical protein
MDGAVLEDQPDHRTIENSINAITAALERPRKSGMARCRWLGDRGV